ncbi:hypothetical protein [Roseateles sp. YR242]|uniref:hypothetical protein n=1 Tax=Roseateles sp. YR242 TaxID=1855305 RepID=UPI000B893494|nr:hypothetical protein [Roseateles sp. YR242]
MIQLNIHEVRQNAGGGSSVVIFDAEVHLTSDGQTSVHVESVEPEDTQPGLVEEASRGILRGVEHVLQPLGMVASVRVRRLVVNSVDFKPSRFTLMTALELKRLMG